MTPDVLWGESSLNETLGNLKFRPVSDFFFPSSSPANRSVVRNVATMGSQQHGPHSGRLLRCRGHQPLVGEVGPASGGYRGITPSGGGRTGQRPGEQNRVLHFPAGHRRRTDQKVHWQTGSRNPDLESSPKGMLGKSSPSCFENCAREDHLCFVQSGYFSA